MSEEHIVITRKNFEQAKKFAIKVLEELKIEDGITIMGLQKGIEMGQHASECDQCNILHHLMASAIITHKRKMEIQFGGNLVKLSYTQIIIYFYENTTNHNKNRR